MVAGLSRTAIPTVVIDEERPAAWISLVVEGPDITVTLFTMDLPAVRAVSCRPNETELTGRSLCPGRWAESGFEVSLKMSKTMNARNLTSPLPIT
jgi:hypothetical protein